jgi:hypothetical protein
MARPAGSAESVFKLTMEFIEDDIDSVLNERPVVTDLD